MNNISKHSHMVRHFSYLQGCAKDNDLKEFEELFKAKCLRTILWKQRRTVDQLKIEQLDKSFPGLRVLSLNNDEITKLPDSIGNLKYLRYLKLDCYNLGKIPNTICKLYNLETLLLEYTCVTRLPTDIGNLIKLRHLSVPNGWSFEEMPLQLGKLQNLQTLNAFIVGRNKDCGGIELLKEFQDLHGSLSIEGLQNVNVSSLKEVSDATTPLKSLKFLSLLCLKWGFFHKSEVDELHKERELLNALQPHPNLKKLEIWRYKGSSFPNWMGDHRCLSNLVSLTITRCSNCSFLPSLGQLPSLKDLTIMRCGVVRIDSEFYCSTILDSSSSVAVQTKPFFASLETLTFEELFKLKEWSFIKGGVFPRLKKLTIEECPYLWCLPKELPTSLSDLHISYCTLLRPRVQREIGEDWPIIAHIPNIILDRKKI
ncbi:putative disease resistance RPP13-like protein 1 [Cannabis sativa]|uniref:putative disease resistance RPP13-like protein 1 n=1 Tax=Cannabis sativa TaxID=3483 RepID=UPI0029C9DE55|nr:putative disease resistance RPP13-like protein 1 [Cannabis sativa]XP_060967425.1 putative disease resistance RPP13-like protein 1 [Cannabis sativa]XP_060967426.1 putative disease resistance RPP13-like protein 1 [Cannabis sativa]XP_060967427.1 putative disease resistance RPP13-like protein 1 [Cannabis sativa]XP_060967428.1 putative disease resistance RPP13-like protein 1 [Cannabis sativa]